MHILLIALALGALIAAPLIRRPMFTLTGL